MARNLEEEEMKITDAEIGLIERLQAYIGELARVTKQRDRLITAYLKNKDFDLDGMVIEILQEEIKYQATQSSPDFRRQHDRQSLAHRSEVTQR